MILQKLSKAREFVWDYVFSKLYKGYEGETLPISLILLRMIFYPSYSLFLIKDKYCPITFDFNTNRINIRGLYFDYEFLEHLATKIHTHSVEISRSENIDNKHIGIELCFKRLEEPQETRTCERCGKETADVMTTCAGCRKYLSDTEYKVPRLRRLNPRFPDDAMETPTPRSTMWAARQHETAISSNNLLRERLVARAAELRRELRRESNQAPQSLQPSDSEMERQYRISSNEQLSGSHSAQEVFLRAYYGTRLEPAPQPSHEPEPPAQEPIGLRRDDDMPF